MHRRTLIESFERFFTRMGYSNRSFTSVVPSDEFKFNLLFVNAGIVNIYPELISGKGRFCSNQMCVRISGKHNDLEEIGTSSNHMTSFEMLGHFQYPISDVDDRLSLIDHVVQFLMSLGIDRELLYLTYHPDDLAIVKVLPRLGLPIKVDPTNSWSAGEQGDRGYCVEIYYRDGDTDMELWNCVFPMRQGADTMYLDSGGGLNRILSVINGQESVYDTMREWSVISRLYSNLSMVHLRTVFDHIKTSMLIVDSGVGFDKKGRGYVVRKLFRRAVWIMISFFHDFLKMSKFLRLCTLLIGEEYSFRVPLTGGMDSLYLELGDATLLWINSYKRVRKVRRWDEDQVRLLAGSEGVPAPLLRDYLRKIGSSIDVSKCLDSLRT